MAKARVGGSTIVLTVVDASIVVAALEHHDARHEAASDALTESAAAGRVLLPASAYAESLVHPMQQSEDAADFVDAFLDRSAVTVVDIDAKAGREAARLSAQHSLALADALVLGLAAAVNADAVLTADREWARISPRVVVV
jgi:predicted nucleic acid-binding protein